jgi:hypothetical protein
LTTGVVLDLEGRIRTLQNNEGRTMNRITRARQVLARTIAGRDFTVWPTTVALNDLMTAIKACDEARLLRTENRLLNEEIAALDIYCDTLREKLGEEVNRYE